MIFNLDEMRTLCDLSDLMLKRKHESGNNVLLDLDGTDIKTGDGYKLRILLFDDDGDVNGG